MGTFTLLELTSIGATYTPPLICGLPVLSCRKPMILTTARVPRATKDPMLAVWSALPTDAVAVTLPNMNCTTGTCDPRLNTSVLTFSFLVGVSNNMEKPELSEISLLL
jgi:hypothetical protein